MGCLSWYLELLITRFVGTNRVDTLEEREWLNRGREIKRVGNGNCWHVLMQSGEERQKIVRWHFFFFSLSFLGGESEEWPCCIMPCRCDYWRNGASGRILQRFVEGSWKNLEFFLVLEKFLGDNGEAKLSVVWFISEERWCDDVKKV